MHAADLDRLLVRACSRFGLPREALRDWRAPDDAAVRNLHRAAVAFLTAARQRGADDGAMASVLGWTRSQLVTRRAALHDLRFSAPVVAAVTEWNRGQLGSTVFLTPLDPAASLRRHVLCSACGRAVVDGGAGAAAG